MKKAIIFSFILLLSLSLFSCVTIPSVDREPASAIYMEMLASEEYFLDVSFIYGGEVYYNTLAQKGGTMAGVSSTLSMDLSHIRTLTKEGRTYFINDADKVYFEADRGVGAGLTNAVDYSGAKYKGSGRDTTNVGKALDYDEYICPTYDGGECFTRLYLDQNGNLFAILDYEMRDGEVVSSLERDVASFTKEIPDGWLELPRDYADIGEDEFFNRYY